ncbi:MAG: hypothetical protein HDS09_02920 [Bacteroides sp.]|nr:hypothetical protein [Bacteroides sp.]
MGISISVNAKQPPKAISPIEVTELGIITFFKAEQDSKISASMDVRELGKMISVNEEHSIKALPPIEVTELGICKFVRFAQL